MQYILNIIFYYIFSHFLSKKNNFSGKTSILSGPAGGVNAGIYLAKKNIFHFLKYSPEAQNLYCKYFSGDTEKDINNDLYDLAIKNLKNFDTIIKFNNYNNDIKKFLEKINIYNIEIPHINKSNNKRKISNEELKAIKFYNIYDIKLFNQV